MHVWVCTRMHGARMRTDVHAHTNIVMCRRHSTALCMACRIVPSSFPSCRCSAHPMAWRVAPSCVCRRHGRRLVRPSLQHARCLGASRFVSHRACTLRARMQHSMGSIPCVGRCDDVDSIGHGLALAPQLRLPNRMHCDSSPANGCRTQRKHRGAVACHTHRVGC